MSTPAAAHAPLPASGAILLVNPASGRGRGAAIGAEIARRFAAAGTPARVVEVGPGREVDLKAALAGAGTVIIVGGDGTLHRALAALRSSGATVYHAPTGTENLFAREFGMTAAEAHSAGAERAVDLGECDLGAGGVRLFALMASVGFDAAVTRRLNARRRGAIRRSTYLGPILAEALLGRPPTLTVECDGDRIVRAQRGLLVVANSRHYAVGLNPARDAIIDDGLLDVVFLPTSGPITLAAWAAFARARAHIGRRGAIYRRARRVRVVAHTGAALQLDGEPVPWAGDGADASLELRVLPGALKVAYPPEPEPV